MRESLGCQLEDLIESTYSAFRGIVQDSWPVVRLEVNIPIFKPEIASMLYQAVEMTSNGDSSKVKGKMWDELFDRSEFDISEDRPDGWLSSRLQYQRQFNLNPKPFLLARNILYQAWEPSTVEYIPQVDGENTLI